MNVKTNVIKSFAVAAATLTAAVGVAGEITVSDVAFAQNDKRDVVITYKLTGSESAVVTVDILTNGVSIGEQNFTRLSGAVNTVVAPSATAIADSIFRVFISPEPLPPGMSLVSEL